MKKRTLYTSFGVVVVTLACTFGSQIGIGTPSVPTLTQGDEVGTIVAATMQALTPSPSEISPTQAPTQITGIPVSLQYAAFVIPTGLAGGADPKLVSAVGEDAGAPWDVAPEHLTFTLSGYPLQGKFHEPRIFVYPAEEYARVQSSAAEQIERLKKILAGFAPMKETLPTVPSFNAGPLIAANIKLIPFQNGNGVRALMQYAQYSAPINNREMFYHFQGLTNDEKYYVIAILPITAPILPEDENPAAAIPDGGVPIPADVGVNNVYYISVTEKLNSLAPEQFTPSLSTLDALIQSILVTNS